MQGDRLEVLARSLTLDRRGGDTMAEGQRHRGTLVVRGDQPLIGIPAEEPGQLVTRYFADEEEADRVLGQDGVRRALSAIGAWSHLDWDETERALDRIRHEGTPTPPIDLDDLV
jgi:hypothetical protein